MYSKVRIAGHPLHPMLVAFPVAFYTGALISFAIYAATSDLFWWRMGFVSNAAGVLGAVLAAIPGAIDWIVGIPRGTPAKATGRTHMLLNVGALLLFTINLLLQADQWGDRTRALETTGAIDAPDPALAVILTSLGVLLTIAAGFFGWKLVQTHHVGVDLSEQQRQLEPPPAVQARHGKTLA